MEFDITCGASQKQKEVTKKVTHQEIAPQEPCKRFEINLTQLAVRVGKRKKVIDQNSERLS
jgi:hypothetical protein